MILSRFCLSMMVVLLLAGVANTQPPSLINYQGMLTDSIGETVATDSYLLKFSLWSDSLGDAVGDLVWTSEYVEVFVKDGLFTYVLGSNTVLPGPDFASGIPLWLGVRVGTDAEAQPRTRLTSVPYAVKAARADTSAFAEVSRTSLRSRDLYHQIIDVGPGDETIIPFLTRQNTQKIVLYLYGAQFQGPLTEHSHSGNNQHDHGFSGTTNTIPLSHGHGFSGTSAGGGSSHAHSGTSNSFNLAHGHSLSILNAGSHGHWFKFVGQGATGPYLVHSNDLTGLSTSPNSPAGTARLSVQTDGSHSHGVSFGNALESHGHGFTTSSITATHSHSYSGSTSAYDTSHAHTVSGAVATSGFGLDDEGIPDSMLPSDVWIYADGVPVAGPYSGNFSTGEIDLTSEFVGIGEHLIEIREMGGNGGRLTYNLFVE